MRFRRRILAAASAFPLLAFGGTLPAAAQFYSLEGRFQCLDKPGMVCFDARSDAPAVPAEAARRVLPVVAAPEPHRALPPAAKPAPHPQDPFVALIARMKEGQPASGDVGVLQSRARQGDVRALELLAWANLKGIGVERNPTRAYLLYGMAARLGVTNAKRNQAIVYETMMNPEQRQRALAIEDDVLTPPPQ
jgi:hypothetical protein